MELILFLRPTSHASSGWDQPVWDQPLRDVWTSHLGEVVHYFVHTVYVYIGVAPHTECITIIWCCPSVYREVELTVLSIPFPHCTCVTSAFGCSDDLCRELVCSSLFGIFTSGTNEFTWGIPSQSSASFMAWVAFSRAVCGFMTAYSGHSPGAMASTKAAMVVPSFQSEVKFFTCLSVNCSCRVYRELHVKCRIVLFSTCMVERGGDLDTSTHFNLATLGTGHCKVSGAASFQG